MAYYNYNPTLELGTIAENLYADVGAVAMTLIELRFDQAQKAIERQLDRNASTKQKAR